MDLSYLLDKLQKYDPKILERIVNVYQWGSRVYGTNSPTSDWDFVIAVTHSYPSHDTYEILPKDATSSKEKTFPTWVYEIYMDKEINATMIDVSKFQRMVIEHRLEILEAFFLPDKYKWQEKHKFQFDCDLDVLRR